MAPVAETPLRIEILPAAFLDAKLCADIVELCEQA